MSIIKSDLHSTWAVVQRKFTKLQMRQTRAVNRQNDSI